MVAGPGSSRVVVITGASSGIGRAAAKQFAQQGDRVVLAARRAEALKSAARECELVGARDAVPIPTDVTDAEAVKRLAAGAVERFGRIDVWVNNAAVTLFGQFEETPLAPYKRVMETNFFGYVHGARAVLPYFREQGTGVLINVSSVVAKVGQPYTSAYVATKAAISALSECLRMELTDAPEIHVCTLLPAAIDTPLFRQGANYTGWEAKPLDPVYDPEMVGADIVRLSRHPERERVSGGIGRAANAMHAVSLSMYERMAARAITQGHFMQKVAPPSNGNLFEPMPQWTGISGGFQGRRMTRGPRIALLGAGAALAGAVTLQLLRR